MRAAARRIEQSSSPAERSDFLAILGVLSGRRYAYDQLVRIVGRQAMIQSTLWDTAVAEGMVKGHVDEARALCLGMIREYHPTLLEAATARVQACSDIDTLHAWSFEAPRLSTEAFARLLDREPSSGALRSRRPARRRKRP